MKWGTFQVKLDTVLNKIDGAEIKANVCQVETGFLQGNYKVLQDA